MQSRTISVFYDGSYYTFKWLKALLWARQEFRSRGVRISFINPLQYLPVKAGRQSLPRFANFRDSDAIFFAHHHSHPAGLGNVPLEHTLGVLEQARTSCELVVWLDTADSTGTCRFEVMPYVDLYLKKQALNNTKLYLSPTWGGRIFCDYYHRRYDVDDSELENARYATLNPAHEGKLKISWNVGLGDLFSDNKYFTYIRATARTIPTYWPPAIDRSLDVHFRGSPWPSVAGWQRARTREILGRRKDLSHPDAASKVSYQSYIAEIRNSFSVASPFGWGEICTRDFEAFAFGSTLLKPTMDHLETYPNWYIADETYVPIDWDFTSFDSILDRVASRREDYLAIAKEGQFRYQRAISGATAKSDFANHILSTLGWQ